MQDQKTDINQQIQELRTIISLQEQGKKLYMQLAEEKLSQNRDLLPCLRGTVRDDICALGIAEKRDQVIISEVCRAQKHLGVVSARSAVEMAREKLQNDIFDRVNVCNMLLYELRQRDRALDELRRQLQHLMETETGDKQHQAQMQVIRQLENNIEKTLMKVHTGQKVTTLYLAVRDALKKELAHLPLQLDVLHRMVEMYQGELKGMELMALDAFKATDTAKGDLANLETQFLMERNLRDRSLAAQKERIDRIRLKYASERHRRAQAKGELAVDFPSLISQESLLGTKLEATKSQIEHQAQVTSEVEKVKSAVQCSRFWDIAGRLLAQQKSTVDLQQHTKECEEKKKVLKDKLKELELKQAELKFHQPPISLEDEGRGVQDAFDFAEKDHGHVLTRDEIKKQGLRFIESKMKSGKKKQQSFPKSF
nr:PREDICTED: coiled-coil domain-containing protein 183 [Apteryx mantelli mantelli]